MPIVVWIARLLLAAVFATAGIAKLADVAGTRKSLGNFGVPGFLGGPFAVLLPLAELACAGALLWTGSIAWGASGLLGLLILFSAGIGINLARGNRPDCRCFGQLQSSPIGAQTLVRNGALAAIALFVLWQAQNSDPSGLHEALGRFEIGLPAAAAVLGLLLALHVWTVSFLLRQNGRLLLRVEALEARAGGVDPEPAGLPKDNPAPRFSLQELDGGTVTLDGLMEAGKPVVLIFGEPGCGPCEELFPEVTAWQKEYAERFSIVVISGGKAEANRDKRDKHGLRNILLQDRHEVAEAYRSYATPAAVLIRDGRIASSLAEGSDAIRTLMVRAVLPSRVKQGDPVPKFQLPDLEGEVLDLSTLRGQHTLLLFWDKSCGFCQGMLTDLRTQARVRPAGAPDLVVIAKGSADDNRAQGFGSRVLLDQHFAAATLFGAEGTPAAVLIDEEGRVASDVGVGACGVFELIGFLPYVPTPDATVEAMLKLAKVQRGDTLYDLGCGDGRVVIAAAKNYGAHGVGVDINPERLAEARANAKKASVDDLVRFEERELFDTDIRSATVVTFYLLPKINMLLRSKLLSELKPGTRVVSHAFHMEDWRPEQEEVVDGNHIYLWTIPARQ